MTLKELTAEASLALSRVDVGSLSGRVRDIPDGRTIRYYTTLGIVDRPLSYRGRTALYGRRHLLQLVAVKRLQAQGLTLSDIQERLLGITDAALSELAALPTPSDSTPATAHDEALADVPRSRRDTDFWATPPAEAPSASDTPPTTSPSDSSLATLDRIEGVRLHPEVALLLEALPRSLDSTDIEAIHAAAAPLIQVLIARRLVGTRDGDAS